MPDRSSDVTVSLPHSVTLPVLGVPVRFEADTPAGIAAARQAFGEWAALERHAPGLISAAGPRIRVLHRAGDDPADAPVAFDMPADHELVFRTPGSEATVDIARRRAVIHATASLLADPMQVRHRLLPGVVLSLVCACDRTPVHAAVVARGDAALILAAPPGTGKSTLSYAASRAGYRVLSDDAAYVQTSPELRIWGLTGRSLLMPDAPGFFGELADHVPRLVADGTHKIVVEHAAAWPAAAAAPPVASRAVVCLLDRTGASAVSRARVDAATVRAVLKEGVGVSARFLGPALDAALERLVPDEGGWRMSLSSNPRDALPHLDELWELCDAGRG